jgi:hypothetical protein
VIDSGQLHRGQVRPAGELVEDAEAAQFLRGHLVLAEGEHRRHRLVAQRVEVFLDLRGALQRLPLLAAAAQPAQQPAGDLAEPAHRQLEEGADLLRLEFAPQRLLPEPPRGEHAEAFAVLLHHQRAAPA